MELLRSNKVELMLEGEKGLYVLSIPLNSKLEEAVKMSEHFVQSLQLALDEYLAKKKQEEEKDGEGAAE